MSCARCGSGIYKTEDFISLNKVWHTSCFTCFQCNKGLNKDTAKIFQGELFCECCYTSVIEKLFEVISSPSLNKPCKVLSTPSCALSKTFVQKLATCTNRTCCETKEYCFPAEKPVVCPPRKVHSCSCIPSENFAKNEYCFIFPIPREVANYYNRAHMRAKAKNPVLCNSNPRCPACSCKRTCNEPPKCSIQVRALKNQCDCKSCQKQPVCNTPKRCCCFKSPDSCPPIFTTGCSCCLPSEPECFKPCSPSPPSARSSAPACQCYQKHSCKPCYPPCNYCQKKCCSPPKCAPARPCPPAKCCPPKKCLQKMEGCCQETPKYCCKTPPPTCCLRTAKYCVCGNLNPCNCKMAQIRAQCVVCCKRCDQKVYAAEKVLVSSGAYHNSCFTCYCCSKCLDVKNVYEGCGEIYCKQCYNHFFGIQYYGFGGPNC
ncbi:hypothetical protein HUJ04_000840 [Dendroctonus ponderosae]